MEKLYIENNYPSSNRFYQILKENGIIKSHKEVKEFIEKQSVQQGHSRVIKNVRN